MIKTLFCFVANLFLLTTLAAGDEGCYGLTVIDVTLKGNLSSHMYGKRPQYAPNLNCHYKLKAPRGHKIKITFKDFDVDVSQGCGQDRLSILGKDYRGALGTFCGYEKPRPLLSVENELIVVFQTDIMQEGRGYLLEYESGPNMRICELGLRQCKNRNCYNAKKECDGVDDCGDGTDEENCRYSLHVTPAECGKPEIDPKVSQGVDRMVGGEEAVPNSWPWQVSLQSPNVEPNGHFCGGTLINNLWVLTATHCVEGRSRKGEIKIVLGSHGKFTKTSYEQVRYSARVISFPDFVGEDIREYDILNDMTLIRLNAPVQLSAGVHPACLPYFKHNPHPGWECYATGWGETRGSGSSHALKQTFQKVKTLQECFVNNQTTQLCVGNAGQSACHGDSGGPLVCKVSDQWFLMGAASYVTTGNLDKKGICAGPGAYTVYSTTAPKYDWVVKTIVKYTQMF